MDLSGGTDLGLTREQETCLKSQLFKLCVQDEVAIFMEHPENVDDTMLVKFFKQKTMEFPLWSHNDRARSKLEEFISKLPTYLTVSQRATKHDMQNRKLRVFLVANFNSMVKTPKERRHDLRRTLDDYSPEQDMKEVQDPAERVRQNTIAHLAKEVARISLAIFLELEQHGGVDRFFAIVRTHSKLCDLPPLYQKFFQYMGKISAVEMERTYSDRDHVSSLKKLYKLTPVKAVKGLLTIADPASLLDKLVNLFLARPFGAQSLTQKIAAAGSELKQSKTQLGDAKTRMKQSLKHKLKHKQIQHILSVMNAHANTVQLPVGEEEDFVGREQGQEIIDYDRLVPVQTVKDILLQDGVFSLADVEGLSDVELEHIREVLVYEMRVKSKLDFVELWGNQDTTSTIKEIVPTFFSLMTTLKKADVGDHLEKYFKAMKAIVRVSEETKGLGVEERIIAYEKVLEGLQQNLYGFIHSLFVADATNGDMIRNSFEWYVDMVKFVHRREALDIQQLLVPYSEEERATIVAELNGVLDYYNIVEQTGKPPATRPVLPSIVKMKSEFMAMLRMRLEPDTQTNSNTTATQSTTTTINTTDGASTTVNPTTQNMLTKQTDIPSTTPITTSTTPITTTTVTTNTTPIQAETTTTSTPTTPKSPQVQHPLM